MDWFGIGALWLGAAVFAIGSGKLPLMPGAPEFLASGWWAYVPLALVTVAAGIMLYRAIRPAATITGAIAGPEAEQQHAPERLGGAAHAVQMHFDREDLRVWDLAPRDNQIIRDKVFVGCIFYGPVAVAFEGCDLVQCRFPHPSLSLIEIEKGRELVGVYFFLNCRFDRCEFRQTAIVGTPEFIARLRALPIV